MGIYRQDSPIATATSTSNTSSLPPPPPPPPPPSHPFLDAPPPFLPSHISPLLKQKSWSPDSYREEAWIRRKDEERRRRRRSKSVTDQDVDELKACIELGFGFDSPDMDPRLSDTFPAYGLFYAVNKQYSDMTVSRKSLSSSSSFSSTSHTSSSSSLLPECESDSPAAAGSCTGSPLAMFSPGEDPNRVKTRLRQWAQVVACSVRQSRRS